MLIEYKHVSEGHEFMKGLLLKVDQGLTHSVLKEDPVENIIADNEAEDDDENKINK